jgi:hypothetical protein
MVDPRTAVASRRRIGAPLPVEYVELIAWFFPQVGDGEMRITRWTDDGRDDVKDRPVVADILGPWDAQVTIPRMANEWTYQVARMTRWAQLDGLFVPGFGPASGPSSSVRPLPEGGTDQQSGPTPPSGTPGR